MRNDSTDPIIDEVRAARHAHAARFDYDISAIFQDIRAMQEKSERAYLRLPARLVPASDGAHARNGEGVDPDATGST